MRRTEPTKAARAMAAGRSTSPCRVWRPWRSTTSQYCTVATGRTLSSTSATRASTRRSPARKAASAANRPSLRAWARVRSSSPRYLLREGQAPGLSHGGHHHQFHGQVEILHQAPDHHGLLEVLLAEEGQVRLDHVEELGHHRGHAPEMPGPELAAEGFPGPSGIHVGAEARGVDFREFRQEEDVDAHAQAEVLVALQVLGVLGQILGGAELGGVHEDGDHCPAAAGGALAYEGRVALVEEPHGGHEADALAAFPEGPDGGSEFGDGADNSHSVKNSFPGLRVPRGPAGRFFPGYRTPWNLGSSPPGHPGPRP